MGSRVQQIYMHTYIHKYAYDILLHNGVSLDAHDDISVVRQDGSLKVENPDRIVLLAGYRMSTNYLLQRRNKQ